jgi:SWI/SNF-related matrix-associated actin-dependent regulator of chromatin subfamily A protein 2/4
MCPLQVKDVETQLPEKVAITVKCPMSAYQSAIYNWIKATNTVRTDPVFRRVAHANRAWEPLQNKVVELRKVRVYGCVWQPWQPWAGAWVGKDWG